MGSCIYSLWGRVGLGVICICDRDMGVDRLFWKDIISDKEFGYGLVRSIVSLDG